MTSLPVEPSLDAPVPDDPGAKHGSAGPSGPATPGAPAPRRGHRQQPGTGITLLRQIAIIAIFYAAYTVVRDLRGTRPVSATVALHDAERLISLERTLGIFHEAAIQHALIGDRFVVELLDDWYGSAHFVVTAAVLAVLFFVYRDHYRRWRNALAVATALALIGFAVFPVMPPRLLPASYGFTDTLRVIGGLWNFESGPMPHLSDQFAAMPSLHFAWALWCGAAIFVVTGTWWGRLIGVVYPAITLLCVIVTANHYFTDVAAGALIVVVGYGAAVAAERTGRRMRRPIGAGASRE